MEGTAGSLCAVVSEGATSEDRHELHYLSGGIGRRRRCDLVAVRVALAGGFERPKAAPSGVPALGICVRNRGRASARGRCLAVARKQIPLAGQADRVDGHANHHAAALHALGSKFASCKLADERLQFCIFRTEALISFSIIPEALILPALSRLPLSPTWMHLPATDASLALCISH